MPDGSAPVGFVRPLPLVRPNAVVGLVPGLPIGWFPPSAEAAAPTGYLRRSIYCWPSVHRLVITQYRTRPNGQYRPVSANSGMTYAISFCDWPMGLSEPVGIMPRFMLCLTVRYVVSMLSSTTSSTTTCTCSEVACRKVSLIFTPKIWALPTLLTKDDFRLYFSGTFRLASAMARSTLNKAKKSGNWSTTGKQPISGLTPASWYSFIVSALSFSLSPLYFLRISLIFGVNAVIARCVCICLTNSGSMSNRIATTRMAIESTQVTPLVGPKTGPSTR